MVRKQTGEAFVFVREEPLPLRYRPLRGSDVELRNHSDPSHPDVLVYQAGVDFIVDEQAGTIRRTKDSRIPDGSRHPMYGINGFDHLLFSDYSNRSFTVYADYWTVEEGLEDAFPAQDLLRSGLLKRTAGQLASGEEALYIVYGDSISAGGEASKESFTYYGRFAGRLQSLFPQGRLRMWNQSVGGETSAGGAARLREDVLAYRPDLVSIGYGMNDQNRYDDGNGVPLDRFRNYLRHMVEIILERCGSDIVLVTPCEPHPRWKHTSSTIDQYAEVIRRIGSEYRIGVADAHRLWTQELAAGKTPESLLLNHVNHPNDYGHWIYSCAFAEMLKKGGT